MKRHTTLCPEGWYYLLVLAFVFAGAMLREVNLMLVLAGMLLGPMLFNWRMVAVTLSGLDVRRKLPQGVCAGDLLVVNLELTNRRKRIGSWAVAVTERVERVGGDRRAGPIEPSVLFPYVPAGQSRGNVYRGRLTQRGLYRLGPLRVSTRFPFGLFSRTITVAEADTLVVFPRLGRLTRRWVTRHHEAFDGAQRRQRRGGRTTGDLYGVREWRSGDNRRWIHWRSSARHGKLVVCQFEQYRNRDVAVLVDLWQPAEPAPQHRENVELAVSFAATLVNDLCRSGGSNLLVAATAAEPRCTAGPASPALQQNVMEELAVAEPDCQDRLGQLLDSALGQIDPGTEVILVSTRPVDLSDPARFAALCSDPARRALLRRIRIVNTADETLAEFFQPQ